MTFKSLFIVTTFSLFSSVAWAQAPSPAQVGITTAVPNVVQVYDSSHNWATIGTVDPATHLFSPAGVAGVLPIASTTVLGAVKVDGTTITATSGGVISGTPAGITANSTVTSGFSAGAPMMSDGTKVQAAQGVFTNWSNDSRFPLYVAGIASIPSTLQISGTNAAGVGNYGVGINADTSGGGGINIDNGTTGNGYYGFTQATNAVGATPRAAIMSDGDNIINVRNAQFPNTPEQFRVQNTYTDSSNGEWGGFDWVTTPNTLIIDTKANGTGTIRGMTVGGFSVPSLHLQSGYATLDMSGGWSNFGGSTTVSNLYTSYSAGVPVVDCAAGSTVTATDGMVTACGASSITANTTSTSGFSAGQLMMSDGSKTQTSDISTTNGGSPYLFDTKNYSADGSAQLNFLQGGATTGYLSSNYGFNTYGTYGGFGFSPNYSIPEISLVHTTTNVMGLRGVANKTVPTAFRAYNTYTDGSNGEWGGFDWQTIPNSLKIGTSANGTGAVRQVYVGTPSNEIRIQWPFVEINSNLYVDNDLHAQAAIFSGASQGVNCAAGTVSLTTLVVTNGIITHC